MACVFDPEIVGECARSGLGLPLDQAFDNVTTALAARYPHKLRKGPRRWILNNAGGAMGQIALLYCSLDEYLLLFGSPIGTEGHSGRYMTEVYDWVLDGEMWCYIEGETQRTVYLPGSCAHLGPD